jgi:hypothetical protein
VVHWTARGVIENYDVAQNVALRQLTRDLLAGAAGLFSAHRYCNHPRDLADIAHLQRVVRGRS